MHPSHDLKSQAKRLRKHLADHNLSLSHAQALEAVAAAHGFKDWNTASAAVQLAPAPEHQVVTPDLYLALETKGRAMGMQAIADALADENLSSDDLYGLFARMANLRERSTPLSAEESPLVIQILERMGQARLSG